MADYPKIGLEAILEDEQFRKAMAEYAGGVDDMTTETEGAASTLSTVFTGLGTTIAAFAAAAAAALVAGMVAFGKAAWDAGIVMDDAMDGIVIATGATGDELAQLEEDFKNVFTQIPISAEDASAAIAILNSRLEVTGVDLVSIATPLAEASRLMGEDVATNATAAADAIGLWNISAQDAPGVLDQIFVAAQQSGMGFGELLGIINTATPTLQGMGLSMEDSIALIASMEDAGINSSTAMRGMRSALDEMAASGVPVEEAFNGIIDSIANATSEEEALTLAIDAFGTMSGPAMVTAIRSGALSLDEMTLALQNADGAIYNTSVNTADFGERWTVLKNKLTLALEPIGTALVGMATTLVEKLTPAFESVLAYVTDTVVPFFETTVMPFIDDLFLAFEQLAAGDMQGALSALFPPEVAEKIMAIGTALSEFITGTLLPFVQDTLTNVVQPGISNFGTIWEETVKPAIEEFWGWLTENIFPIIADLVVWFQEEIPVAIERVQTTWEESLKPALDEIYAAFNKNILPILEDVWEWLEENVPEALQTLSDFWTQTLYPAMIEVYDWVVANLIPILTDMAVQLMEDIPVAIQTLSDFWTDTLKPAIEEVWAWMNDSLFPTLSALWEWLSTAISGAVTALSDLWTGTLQPALEIVWGFLNESIIPLFTALWDLFNVAGNLALTALQGLWENVLLPALTAVADYLTVTFGPIWDDLVTFFNDTFGPAVSEISDTFLPALQGAFDGIATAVDTVIGWIEDLTSSLEDIELPDWLTPGSPTPFELGLLGIASAAQVATVGIDDMAGALEDVEGAGDVSIGLRTALAGAQASPTAGMMGMMSPAMASSSTMIGSQNRTLNMPVTNNIYGGLSAGAIQQMVQQALANAFGGVA